MPVFGPHYLFWNTVGLLGTVALFAGAVVYEPWFAVIPAAGCLLQAIILVKLIRYRRLKRELRAQSDAGWNEVYRRFGEWRSPPRR